MKNIYLTTYALLILILLSQCNTSQEKKKKEDATKIKKVSDIEKGLKYVLATKAVLGKNLMNAIQTKGVGKALSFCSVNAISLTDSMAKSFGVRIKRVSDQNRNPENMANATELEYIKRVKALLLNKNKPKPQMQTINGTKVGYYPILTNNMCMLCHGIPNKDMKPAVLEHIKKLYPNDKAIGYKPNQLRGLWVVELEK